MAGDRVEFKTPVGRLVQGSFFKGSTKDDAGNPLVIKNGPNTGQPYADFYVGIAIPKNDPDWDALWGTISQTAQRDWPNLFQNGQCINPQFSWKYVDGDSAVPDQKGNKPCDKPGFAGHHVLGFSAIVPLGQNPKPVYKHENGTYVTLTDPDSVKRGYYVQVHGSVCGNDSTKKPGVYLNLNAALFVAYGEEIITGPTGDALFGSTPNVTLPAGASVTPIAPTSGVPAGMTPQSQPQGGPSPIPTPAATIQPSPGFLKPPVLPDKFIASDGKAYTEAELIAFGFTSEQIAMLPKA